MNAGGSTVRSLELPRWNEMLLPQSCQRRTRRAGQSPASCVRNSPPLAGLVLAVALAREVQAQTREDMTWAGGIDHSARMRTWFAKLVGVLFAIELVLWVLVYGWRHARNEYNKPMVDLRASVRMKRHIDLETALVEQHSKLKAAGDTHESFLKLRKAAEAEFGRLSPRHGGGNAKGPIPYNPHKQFKRDARSGNVAAFTAWQREDDSHQHHEIILDGQRAALV